MTSYTVHHSDSKPPRPFLKDRPVGKPRSRLFRIVDLFSGIGGFHLGLEKSAFELGRRVKLLFASDIDKAACDTYENNFGIRPLGDIAEIDASLVNGCDVLCGGFPCQPFSNSGLKKGLADERGGLFYEIKRMIQEGDPKSFILENVSGILTNGGKGPRPLAQLQWAGQTCKQIGTTMVKLEAELRGLKDYRVTWAILNTSHYGSPQVRRRVFVVGVHKDLAKSAFRFPKPSPIHNTMRGILEPNVSDKFDLNPNQWANVVKDMRARRAPTYRHGMRRVGRAYHCPGGNVGQTYHIDGLMPTLTRVWARFLPIYLPAKREQLPPSLQMEVFEPGIHYGKGHLRKATPREGLRLQGFPDNFKPNGSPVETYKQVGNAVHCMLVKAIGDNLLPMLI